MTAILLRDLISSKNPQLAEESLLKLPALRKFDDALKSKGEKEHFRRHLRKYVNMWLPDCPFEVSTTNRYTIVTQEAATTARRYIKKNEPIKYLCGYLVSMTPEEEQLLDQSKRDFSIVMSSRKKTASLFMGPARFANHDCNANARLMTKGFDGMLVVAVRDISLGEEITVTYGDNYFGEANCECLCRTCETAERNGWTPRQRKGEDSPVATPLAGLEENASPSPYSFRKTRKYSHFTESSHSAAPDTDGGSPRKRRRARNSKNTPSIDKDGQKEASAVKSEPSEPGMSSETLEMVGKSSANLPTRTAGKRSFLETVMNVDAGRPDEDALRACVTAAFATARTTSGQEKSSHKAVYQPQTLSSSAYALHLPETTVIQPLSRLDTPSQSSSNSSAAMSVVTSVDDSHVPMRSSPATTPSSSAEPGLDWKSSNAIPNAILDPVSDSDLSDLSANESLDDVSQTVIRRRKRRGRPAKRGPPKVIPTIELEPPVRATRYPNDYTRTSLLLGESYSRWVDCKTCAGCWVQPNGYLTRKECPRCERHSKLYGYQWPKTDKQGKNDKEERVLDHRTVHRFLRPEEEALVKKRGKGVQGAVAFAFAFASASTPAPVTVPVATAYSGHLTKHSSEDQKTPTKVRRGREAR